MRSIDWLEKAQNKNVHFNLRELLIHFSGAKPTTESEQDLNNQQTLRIKRIITHSKYDSVTNRNDVALIQMYPSTDDGQCAIFGDTVQPACINQGTSYTNTTTWVTRRY